MPQTVELPRTDTWPALPYAEWKDTLATLHMWTQIVGKIRMTLSPAVNHWWHVPLYVCARGLTTTAIPHGVRSFEMEFDFIDHRLVMRTCEGDVRTVELRPRTVADFYAELMGVLDELGLSVRDPHRAAGGADPIPFERRHHARRLRRRGGQPRLAGPGAGGPRDARVPRAVPGQEQPRALLLGELRPGGHALQRPRRARASRRARESRTA